MSGVYPWLRCYGCGRDYEVTDAETERHTHHERAVKGSKLERVLHEGATREQVVRFLEQCQRERDDLQRLLTLRRIGGGR